MQDIKLQNLDSSTFMVQTLESSQYGGELIAIHAWSDLEGDVETFSTTEIEALLNDTVATNEDKEVVKSYIREQLHLSPDAILSDIPTDLLMDLLDIDGDHDFDGKDLDKMRAIKL